MRQKADDRRFNARKVAGISKRRPEVLCMIAGRTPNERKGKTDGRTVRPSTDDRSSGGIGVGKKGERRGGEKDVDVERLQVVVPASFST